MATSGLRRHIGNTAGETTMIDFKPIDELARRLSELVPPGLREQRDELHQTFRGALQAGPL